LLDTNIVSELTKTLPDPKCLQWLSDRRGQCALSSITLAELRSSPRNSHFPATPRCWSARHAR